MIETIGWITVALLGFIGGIGVAEWITYPLRRIAWSFSGLLMSITKSGGGNGRS